MTKREHARMLRLEAENAHLREQLDRHIVVYRDQLFELVTLRTQLDLVRQALEEQR